VPRYGAQGEFLGYIGSCLDITERKRAETDVRRSQQQLAHVSRVSTAGALAGSMAHELNQPLTAILSNAQAAQRFLNGERVDLNEVREILADIVEEDRRAGEVIVRMRAMLKKGEAKMSPLNLNQVIGEALRLLHGELAAREVEVVAHLATELPLVRGDRIQLQQVLLNLIMNSCDAMNLSPAQQRRIIIKTERVDSGYIQASISDDGPGFAPEFLEQPFEGFRTSKPDGLGLGLVICRSIVLAHGGGFWIANNPDHGANVRFTLAVHRKEMM
jgi:two-component system sensor kinase FixL